MKDYHKWLIFAVIGMICLHLLFVQLGVNLSLSNPTTSPTATPVPSVTPNPTVLPPTNNTTATPTPVPKPQMFKIYFFMQPDCPYCEQMGPTLTTWAIQNCHAERIGAVIIVNLYSDSATPAKYAVRSTPTTVITNMSDKELTRYTGVFDINDLDQWLDAH